MNSKILLVIFCFFQANNGETIKEAIVSLTPQIANVRTNINVIIQNGGQLIGQTYKNIGQLIAHAEDTIHNQLDQLDNVVQEAELEAGQKFVDISECTKPVNELSVDVDLLERNCSKNQDFNLLRIELGNLGTLKKKLSSSISKCLNSNPNNVEGLKKCVREDIDEAQNKSNQIQNQINEVCEEAQQNTFSCLETIVSDLDNEISSVAHDLKICLLNIL